MSLGRRRAGTCDPALEFARARPRLRVQDEHGDIGHPTESTDQEAGTDQASSGVRRARGECRRPGRDDRRGDPVPSPPCRAPGCDGVSRLYATVPVGVVDQPEFRNAVVAIDVPRRARSGHRRAGAARRAQAAGASVRPAERERWGPRELDLDLLVFGRHRIDVERPAEARSTNPSQPTDLVVPHRLAGERLFVLAPLADLAPGLVPPGWSETVETARRRQAAVEGADAVRPIARWADGAWNPTEPGARLQPN